MLVVRVPIEELQKAFRGAEQDLADAEREILRAAVDELVETLERDFRRKSGGGVGGGGVTWERDKLSPGKPVGIVTGDMQRRLITRSSGDAMEVIYAAPWSRHFDERRTLIPDPLPDDWSEKLDRAAQPVAEDVARKAFEGLT